MESYPPVLSLYNNLCKITERNAPYNLFISTLLNLKGETVSEFVKKFLPYRKHKDIPEWAQKANFDFSAVTYCDSHQVDSSKHLYVKNNSTDIFQANFTDVNSYWTLVGNANLCNVDVPSVLVNKFSIPESKHTCSGTLSIQVVLPNM